MSLITQANSHNILCKIGAAKTRTRVDKAAPGVHDDTARVRILTESDIIFCHHVTFYSSSDWSRARLFAKGIDYATVRSSFVTLLLTNNYVRRLPCPFDGDCSAGSPYRCVWRARSRRPHTHATCERRVHAKASSEDALVDVEVDRCIDENSASNHG